ncbi:MAG: hypothetical protein PF503_00710 [Desulfobacula sp.]|jgi:hypothetical protein|nr:hypothetical protein [Desulfobacula sp.]
MKKLYFLRIIFLLSVSFWPVLSFTDSLNNAINFELEGTWQSSKEVNSVYAINNKAYLGNSGDGIVVLDISAPSDPVKITNYLYKEATEVLGDGNYVYAVIKGQLVDNTVQRDKVLIFDISLESDLLIGEYQHNSYRNLGKIGKSGNMLLLTTSSSLILLDVSTPGNPVEKGEYDLGSTNLTAPGLAVSNDIAYVGAGSKNLKILDISNPSDIKLVSEYETDMWAVNVEIHDKTAYVTGWEGGLIAIDVSDPFYPVKAGDYSIESPYIALDFLVKDTFGYLSYINPENRDAGIIGLNLQDLTDIKKAGEYSELEWVNHIFFMDDYLLVANKNNLSILKPFLYHIIDTDLSLVPDSVSISEGNTRKVSIVGGMEPYYVGSSDPSIATAYIDENNTLTIKGVSRGNVVITVTDSTGAQDFVQIEVTQIVKVIIVAGSGPYTGNHLWESSLACTQYAYKVLQYQGYTDETITYLASDTMVDLNGDGIFNEVDGNATSNDLKEAITNWALDAKGVIIFMVGHGSNKYFRIDENELLEASELNTWLNTLEGLIPGNLTFIYDACQSGSFFPHLTSEGGKQRILIASASLGENAYFTSLGALSFSHLFWTQIHNGGNINDSFIIAQNAIEFTYANQTPVLDDNGNGVGNENDDGDLSKLVFIGNGVISAGDIPIIQTVSPETTLNGEISATLYADNIIDSDDIEKVWAIITPPDYATADPDVPVLSVPTVEMGLTGNTKYEGIYMDFGSTGTYNIAIYAQDSEGNISLPRNTSFIQTGGDLVSTNKITFKTNPEASDISFADLFTDSQDTIEWYQLWIGNVAGSQGEYIDTSDFNNYGKGWILKDDLENLKVKSNYSAYLELWVGQYDGETKETIWSHGPVNFSNIIADDSPPSKVLQISPSGTTQDSMPTCTWAEDPASTWYKFWIGYPNGDKIFAKWYEAFEICSGSLCVFTLESELANGDYEWHIKSWNDYGKVWNDGMSFSITD